MLGYPHRYTYLRKDVMMKKQKRMKQITAILLIVILLAIIGSTIYFAVSGSQLFLDVTVFDVFLSDLFIGQCHFCINGVKIRTSTDVSFSVLIFILLSDSFQIFFDIFLISIFRWFIKRCSKKLIWKILLFYIMIWIIMRIFISDSMS